MKHIVRFELERETKNTLRYSEIPETPNAQLLVGKLYLSKTAAEILGNPKLVRATIESDK